MYTLYMALKNYIEKMIDGNKNILDENRNTIYRSPLEKGCYPELDASGFVTRLGYNLTSQ